MFDLNPNVQVGIDATRFLAEPIWQFQQEVDVHAVGHRVVVQIPEDEVWYLWSMSGLSTIPLVAPNSIGLQAIYQDQGVTGREMPLSVSKSSSFLFDQSSTYANFVTELNTGLWCMDGAIGYLVTVRNGATSMAMDWGFQVSKFKR